LVILHCLRTVRLGQRRGGGEGALGCMRVVCSSVGIGVEGARDEGDDWVDEYMDESDLVFSNEDGSEDGEREGLVSTRVRFGWPALQAEVLREIIDIAEVTEGMLSWANT
jgi:hypothetical protein